MQVVDYSKEHYEEIKRWHSKRGVNYLSEDSLPRTGKVVPGLAALFLYKIDSKLAFIENAATNPDADREDRSLALDLCSKEIIAEAKRDGFKTIVGTTFIPGVLERATRFGFSVAETQYWVFWRDLWERS